jgi:hypothetical protein
MIAWRRSGIQRALWRLGVLPYNLAILTLLTAVLLEARVWRVRQRGG